MSQEQPRSSKLGWLLFGLIMVVLLVASLTGNPGCEPVVPQPTNPDKPTPLPPGKHSAFKIPWNSESTANWPVTEPLAEMCKHAYLAPDAARGAFATLGFFNVSHFPSGSMVVYVMTSEDLAVVSFRGTDDIPDWFVNLDAFPISTSHGEFHQGFYESYGRLSQQISDAVRKSKAKYVWITGHSLGGALALVCAYDFIETQQLPVTGVITFGQPMVALNDLAQYLDSKLLGRFAHLVNESDIVPRVPPGYSHCGSLVWFSDGKIFRSRQKRPQFGTRSSREADMDETTDLRPLTPAEFEIQKQRVRENQRRMMALPEGQMKVEGQLNVQGNLPFLENHKMEHYIEKVRSFVVKQDEEKQFPFDRTVDLVERQKNLDISINKGQTLELRIFDPPMPQMVKEMKVNISGSISHLGDGRRSDTAPTGRPMTGSGWYCIYLRVDGSGKATLRYSKTGMAQEKTINITAQ